MSRFLFRPDLSPSVGSGHAMRDLALAEELIARGHEVVYSCSTERLLWVEEAIRSRGCGLLPPPSESLASLAVEVDADVVVVDSYTLPSTEYSLVSARGIPLVTIADHERRGAIGDLIVDPSPTMAGEWDEARARGQRVVSGVDYALVRREFRSSNVANIEEAVPLRVLVAFGGTDIFGASVTMIRLLLEIATPLTMTVVTRPDLGAEIARLPRPTRTSLTVLTPGRDFPTQVRSHDVVISAAGATSWELLAMGTATGLVCVADNQKRYFEALPETGSALRIGTLAELRGKNPRVKAGLEELIASSELRESLRASARRTVDGRGAERVATELIHLL